ncbi:hypothetical protein [Catellatospora sp. NPDC049609]|uniref:hypothetical protein n=1 Tax=Catellatospora sp. NPDC049609 TaxID=3155505 RepID=UPI003435BB30
MTSVRWVLYEAAVFVRVEADENGANTEITKVVTANDADVLRLALHRGRFVVYDENFEPVNDDLRLDGIRGAVSVAEDRHRWPAKEYPAWDDGPDPRRYPDLYADDEGEDPFDGDDDELEPLELW